ncbi:MAG: MBL fold metallo-hydrolase [Cytophagales bacterium]|nr:MAG: MBL fold metallo-hydrolase [Cytophagales bacterium]
MRLTFWGAARQVTGSMYLLELEDDYKILIDCGLDTHRKPNDTTEQETQKLGSMFPFEASQIRAVLLTHAHIDHSGYLPNLVREGFEGTIYCTQPTYDLAAILLADAAVLNQKKIKRQEENQKNKKKSRQEVKNTIKEMYLQPHVERTLPYFKTIPFKQKIKINAQLQCTFIPTGHLLGAANIVLEVIEKGEKKTICFSGDVGRKNYPLLPDPETVPEVDYLICETTYGNRLHKDKDQPEEIIRRAIHQSCVENTGRLLIPAFSVGRTQAILYVLHKLSVNEQLPAVKIFADSPLAVRSTQIYEKYRHLMNEEAQVFAESNKYLFDFDNLVFIESAKESKTISTYPRPCVIISSSGMLQGGRIEHHVKANLQNPKATILMIGYAAEGTLGYELLQGSKTYFDGKKELPILAQIQSIDAFSGHGDREDLTNFVKYQKKEKLKNIFLVHGEYTSMIDFKQTLAQEGYQHVEIPYKGQSFEL